MRNSVADLFPTFSESFEGYVTWMYQDILGLVSTGIGNLIDFGKPVQDMSAPRLAGDPPEAALSLPWHWKLDGRPASRQDIEVEWRMVKAHPTAAKQGHRVLDGLTNLRLSKEDVENLVRNKALQNEAVLRGRFPDFDEWPAEAQLATHSMAWACGPGFRFPRLADALLAQDFARAADECHIDDSHNPGVTPRNAANVALYETAAHVVFEGLDRDILRYKGKEYGAPEEPQPNTVPIIHSDVFRDTYEAFKNGNGGEDDK